MWSAAVARAVGVAFSSFMTSTSTSIALRQLSSQRGLLSATAYLRNRWLQQDEILARLTCVEPDDRSAFCGEG